MRIEDIINKGRFSILLGKNGSGKSTLLRTIDSSTTYNTKYISPERGGTLKYDPNVDLNISNNVNWITNDRRKNRTEQFRQQSAAQFRDLEVKVLREIESDLEKRLETDYKFDRILDRINELLPAINLNRADRGFDISNKDGQKITEENISSGESELISLTIEVLVFSRSNQENKLLLMDEPDVHLHPDLQQKFVEFIESVANEFQFKVVIATHSTAIVGAFSKSADLQIVPITKKDQQDFSFFKYEPICHELLPVFGAHPLSSQFNRIPALLVEGDDDKRVIEQVVRSSQGKINFMPCVVGTVTEMNKWEVWLNNFLPSIYDVPKGFSLRDLDDSEEAEISDIGCVIRTRLNCYAIENILLSNECLDLHNCSANEFILKLNRWVEENPTHQTRESILLLSNDFSNRRTLKIKDLRNLVLALLGTSKPWEVLIGQLIAINLHKKSKDPNSLHTYLGENVLKKLFSL